MLWKITQMLTCDVCSVSTTMAQESNTTVSSALARESVVLELMRTGTLMRSVTRFLFEPISFIERERLVLMISGMFRAKRDISLIVERSFCNFAGQKVGDLWSKVDRSMKV